ncbi:glycosyltransferase family 2 protein [Desulfonauticus submarinus]
MSKKSITLPKVCILILNWNGWKDTIECLESVFRNTYPNYQIIIIDNGSTNGSMEKIKAWAEGKQKVLTPDPSHPLYHLSHPPVQKPIPYIEYDRKTAETGGLLEKEKELYKKLPNGIPHPLILIQTGDNLGFAGGNNVGIRYALSKNDCEYVWLLNNDTVIDKEALVEMVKLAEKDEKIGMVGAKVFYYDAPKKFISVGGSKKIGWVNVGKCYGHLEFDNAQYDKNLELEYINGASLLIKKSIIDKVGLMDERYFMDLEDVDWGVRARKEGFKLFYNYNAKVWHKEGGSSINEEKPDKSKERHISKFFRVYYGIRNEIFLVKKNYPWRFPIYVLLIVPYRITRSIAGLIFYNDSRKIYRIKLIFLSIVHGLFNRMGKTIDPHDIMKGG